VVVFHLRCRTIYGVTRELDRSAEKKRARQRQSLLREEVAVEGNVVHDIDSENNKELQCAIHVSREEEQYARRV
jgi:hypothetical protein